MTEKEWLEKWIKDYTHDIDGLELLDPEVITQVWGHILTSMKNKRQALQNRLDEINDNHGDGIPAKETGDQEANTI